MAKNDYREIGRPLTLRMHESAHRSLLEDVYDTKSGKQKVKMAGVTNLLFLLLVVVNVKNVLTSLREKGFTLKDVFDGIFNSRELGRTENHLTQGVILSLALFVLFSFIIEKMAANDFVGTPLLVLVLINLALTLVWPMVAVFIIEPDYAIAALL